MKQFLFIILFISSNVTFSQVFSDSYTCCSREDVEEVEINCFDATTLNIPSGITPNGDGNNDVFYIYAINICREIWDRKEITIYNRWGNELFHAKDYQNDWDGGRLPEGVYYYILELDLGKGLIVDGHVTIIR